MSRFEKLLVLIGPLMFWITAIGTIALVLLLSSCGSPSRGAGDLSGILAESRHARVLECYKEDPCRTRPGRCEILMHGKYTWHQWCEKVTP